MPKDCDERIRSAHGMAVGHAKQQKAEVTGTPYTFLYADLAAIDDNSCYSPEPTANHTLLVALSRRVDEVMNTKGMIGIAPVYTYFGQFVSHDTSAPVPEVDGKFEGLASGVIASISEPMDLDSPARPARTGDVLKTLRNQHDRPLSLASLYGTGPFGPSDTIRSFYDETGRFIVKPVSITNKTALANAFLDADAITPKADGKDIPRAAMDGVHVPLIADQRNDDNLILSQLHLALMLFHNRAMDALAEQSATSTLSPQKLFDTARALVTRHYHYCVLNDWARTVLHEASVDAALATDNPLGKPGEIPLEFTTAALRFGHSMVSNSYDYNAFFGVGGQRSSASLLDLFQFTSRNMMDDPSGATVQLPAHWVAEWSRLTQFKAGKSGADKIDTVLAGFMTMALGGDQMSNHMSISFRNLLRGYQRRIPFGQLLAKAVGVPVLAAGDIKKHIPASFDGAYDRDEIAAKTPAWLYFLCESQLTDGGKCVGPTASRIIAETLVGLIRNHPDSILAGGKPWKPDQSSLLNKDSRPIEKIEDMLEFAGVMG